MVESHYKSLALADGPSSLLVSPSSPDPPPSDPPPPDPPPSPLDPPPSSLLGALSFWPILASSGVGGASGF